MNSSLINKLVEIFIAGLYKNLSDNNHFNPKITGLPCTTCIYKMEAITNMKFLDIKDAIKRHYGLDLNYRSKT